MISTNASRNFNSKIAVDSVPIFERAIAAKTEFGFIGKNTCYIHPKKGSFFLLGEIILDEVIKQDSKLAVETTKRTDLGGCGSCKRCQVHCPTGALDKEYELDANLCLSYWSIESRGIIPEKFWPWFSKFYFGCDICQLVCPYNRGDVPLML